MDHQLHQDSRQSGRTPAGRGAEPSLAEIEARLARIEESLEVLRRLGQEGPQLAAVVTDTADDLYAQAADRGVDIDARLTHLARLLERATEPQVLETMELLIEHIDVIRRAVEMADRAPQFVAMIVDIFDDKISVAAREGLSLEAVLGQLFLAARRFATFVQGEQFQVLLESGVLDIRAVSVIGRAGRAIADVAERAPRKTGIFGAMRAAGDGDVKRTLNFAVRFTKRFGQLLRTQLPAEEG